MLFNHSVIQNLFSEEFSVASGEGICLGAHKNDHSHILEGMHGIIGECTHGRVNRKKDWL